MLRLKISKEQLRSILEYQVNKTVVCDWEYPLIRGIKKVWGFLCGKRSISSSAK